MEKISYENKCAQWNKLRNNIQQLANQTGASQAIYEMLNGDLQLREYHKYSRDYLILFAKPEEFNNNDNKNGCKN